ncbi:MAG: hypothetical protein JXA99_13445 [Candidatus Lokiarchaeota archaeon]|nr:hypothetical protein [Candidatus Lokiarchaeota archaeon]
MIGIVHGVGESSLNIFFSWIFIGFWLLFIIKYREKVRKFKDYNSPHNTSFFVLAVIFTGLLYLYIGYYTDLFNWNWFQDSDFYFFLNPWIFFLSFPLLMAGLSYIYTSMKKYEVIYIYKTTSIKARKFCVLILFFILILNIIFIVLISENKSFYDIYPNYTHIGLVLFLFIIFSLLIIIYGFIKKSKRSSSISQDALQRRRSQIQSISTRQPRQQRQSKQRSKPKPRTRPKPRTTTTSRPKPTRSINRQKPTPKVNKSKSARIKEIERLKPSATILSLEDFKCIFCFSLPKYPEDQRRGIVLCPNCNYPAHADEFKDWMKNNQLCSRCNSTISSSFRSNPKIIPTKNYAAAIKYYSKKENLK